MGVLIYEGIEYLALLWDYWLFLSTEWSEVKTEDDGLHNVGGAILEGGPKIE